MGSFSIWHWLIVLAVVVLIFGTKRLRNIGQDLGEAVKGFKKGLSEEDQKRLRDERRSAVAQATANVAAADANVQRLRQTEGFKRVVAPFAGVITRRNVDTGDLLDAGTGDGADVAATLGYFDQPHFVREFRGFTSVTPTQYASRRSALPSHVGLPG